MTHFSVAIDGPAGAGKSTIAKKLAQKLQCIYIDTGAMYRTVGYYCLEEHINYQDEKAVNDCIDNIYIDIAYTNNVQTIYLNKVDVSQKIRTQEVASAASKVATYSHVREALVDMQRNLAKSQSVVMDGRDIGTVVLPKATLKIFLTASAEERANRRYLEYKAKGIMADYEVLLKEIKERDEQDSNRLVSPLKQAEDAVAIDTTAHTIDEVVETIYELIKSKKIGVK